METLKSQITNLWFTALEDLERYIKNRWGLFSVERQTEMTMQIIQAILRFLVNEHWLRVHEPKVNTVNAILVQILRRVPDRLGETISQLAERARSHDIIFENFLAIVKLICTEILDSLRGDMTVERIEALKKSREFVLVHDLCLDALSRPGESKLKFVTLSALHAFLSWIPVNHIFLPEVNLFDKLLHNFAIENYRNLILQCLTMVTALSFGRTYVYLCVTMYERFMSKLQQISPSIRYVDRNYVGESSEKRAFCQKLALLFYSFYTRFLELLESRGSKVLLEAGLQYLLHISLVDDTQVFKVCLECWDYLVHHNVVGGTNMRAEREQKYPAIISKLREIMILKMAKPEEVLIVEDENGNIIRENMKDNDVIVQNKIMKRIFVRLYLLDQRDTENKIKEQATVIRIPLTALNLERLCIVCRAVGYLSHLAPMTDMAWDLVHELWKCYEIHERNYKDVIASNIMYIIGRLVKGMCWNWRRLKGVVKKLCQFMRETHAGVKDMACVEFLRIAENLTRQFVIVQVGENETPLSHLLSDLETTVADLELRHIHAFYKSVCRMLKAESDNRIRDEYLNRLMKLSNRKWTEIIERASRSVEFLKDGEMIRKVLSILVENTAVAEEVGEHSRQQMELIIHSSMKLYRVFSALFILSREGRGSTQRPLRLVKGQTIRLYRTFLDHGGCSPEKRGSFLGSIMDMLLGDYAINLPGGKEPEVLSLFATAIRKCGGTIIDTATRVYDAVFYSSVEMFDKNFENYPRHELELFSLLNAVATYCFPTFLRFSSQKLQVLMNLIFKRIRHPDKIIADAVLDLLKAMLAGFEESRLCREFYESYFFEIQVAIWTVLTDRFHKSSFFRHTELLKHLFEVALSDRVSLFGQGDSENHTTYNTGSAFLRTRKMLNELFCHMGRSEVDPMILLADLMEGELTQFQNKMEKLVIQLKIFSAQEMEELRLQGTVSLIMEVYGDRKPEAEMEELYRLYKC